MSWIRGSGIVARPSSRAPSRCQQIPRSGLSWMVHRVARQIGRGVIATLGFHPSQARDGNGAATALCTSRSAMAHCACRLRVRALRPWFGRFRWLSVCPANGCLRMCRCGFMAGCSHCRSMCWVMVLVACSCRAHRQLHGTDVPQPWQPILGGRAMAGYEITPRSLVSAIM